ncbi:MAG: redoxin domain-containing protein [Odoribacter splanchnicus]
MKSIVTGMMKMNQWILLFSLILGLGGTGCENRESGIITIMGEIKGLPEGWVRLYTCPPSNLLLDSCEIREGKYKLKGKLDDPQLGMLFFDVKPEYQPNFMPMVRLFLQPTIMKVYSEREDMKGSLKVENAPLNEQLIACEQFLKNLPEYKQATVLTDSIQLAFYKADMVKVRSMSVVRDSLYQVLIDRVFEKEPEASHSEVVAYLASQYSSPMSGDRVERIVERFDSSFRNSYYVAQMKQFAENDRLLTAGKVFPDFQVFDTLGKTYTLADFKGKYLLIEFSASWCGWCKKEIPHIRKAYEHLKDRNIVFITMMMDTEREQWIRDMKREEIGWLCLTDLKGMKKSPLVDAYNLRGLPDSFVVDPEGYIIRRDLRGGEILDYLSEVVTE